MILSIIIPTFNEAAIIGKQSRICKITVGQSV
jgi:hypothetical protein